MFLHLFCHQVLIPPSDVKEKLLKDANNPKEVLETVLDQISFLKGAVSQGFSSRFVKTLLKLRLNAFAHTQNAPGTSRGRY